MDPVTPPSRASTSKKSVLSGAKGSISQSLSLRRKGKENASEPKGPLGLSTLHVPDQGHTIVADLVFVHGLNGGSFSTWSKDHNPDCYWPRQ